MSTPTITLEPTVNTPDDLPLWRMSVEKYHKAIDAGVLAGEPIELLEGWLICKVTKNIPHASASRRIRAALAKILPSNVLMDNENPITLQESQPEPDIFIVRGQLQDYETHHPFAEDILLVVEISDSTLQQDRTTKKRIYARAGIPIYWLANLVDDQIEVYNDPSGPTQLPDYHQRRDYQIGDTLPVVIDGDEIGQLAVDDLLP